MRKLQVAVVLAFAGDVCACGRVTAPAEPPATDAASVVEAAAPLDAGAAGPLDAGGDALDAAGLDASDVGDAPDAQDAAPDSPWLCGGQVCDAATEICAHLPTSPGGPGLPAMICNLPDDAGGCPDGEAITTSCANAPPTGYGCVMTAPTGPGLVCEAIPTECLSSVDCDCLRDPICGAAELCSMNGRDVTCISVAP